MFRDEPDTFMHKMREVFQPLDAACTQKLRQLIEQGNRPPAPWIEWSLYSLTTDFAHQMSAIEVLKTDRGLRYCAYLDLVKSRSMPVAMTSSACKALLDRGVSIVLRIRYARLGEPPIVGGC